MIDEDMRVGMFLSSTFDCYEFLLSFLDDIIEVELLYHVGSEILDGT